ncbi:hypothetical protein Tco_0748584 [Tanacetum coccineum]|uniref:Uncharacterized protein n=1 Tax=Tanacetum coccineum TaxID=301880 RepID=A0ABQ4YZG6_9ASTR
MVLDLGGGGGDANPGIPVWIERFTKLCSLRFASAYHSCRGRRLDYAYGRCWEAMLLAILVLGLLFVRSFKIGIFRASEQQRYEREYGSICQLDRENSGEYMERVSNEYRGLSGTRVFEHRVVGSAVMDSKRQVFRVRIKGLLAEMGTDLQGSGSEEVLLSLFLLHISCEDCPKEAEAVYACGFARLPPIQGRIYAMTRDQWRPRFHWYG